MEQTLASKYEPKPKSGNTRVLDLVQQDLIERAEVGLEKYNTYLETSNGRKAKIDAYQEALDLSMYLRQLIEEENQLYEMLNLLETHWKENGLNKAIRFGYYKGRWQVEVWGNERIIVTSSPQDSMYGAMVSVFGSWPFF